jgi:hypothetical protein
MDLQSRQSSRKAGSCLGCSLRQIPAELVASIGAGAIVVRDTVWHIHHVVDTLVVPLPQATTPPPPWYTGLWGPIIGAMAAIVGGLAAQWFRGWLEDRRRCVQLLHRLKRILERLADHASALDTHDPERPLGLVALQDIVTTCHNYDRVSDDMTLLKDVPLSNEIDTFIGNVRIWTEQAIKKEEEFSTDWQRTFLTASQHPKSIEALTQKLGRRRKDQVLDPTKSWKTTAERLLAKLNQAIRRHRMERMVGVSESTQEMSY